MHTRSGSWSWTMVGNVAFLVLYVLVQLANAFGFGSFQPPAELALILPAIVAIINLLLRYFHTEEAIKR